MNGKAVLLAALMVLVAQAAFARGQREAAVGDYTPEGYFHFSASFNSAVITGFQGPSTDVRIPPQIMGRLVTAIGARAFANSGLASVTIPDSVTRIEGAAFLNNRLESISIGSGVVYIGFYAFAFNRLTSIPDTGRATVHESAFSNNPVR